MHRLLVLLVSFGAAVVAARAQPDGALKWAFTTLSSATPGAILSSPALAPDGTIYFGVQVGSTQADASGRVIALTPSGALKWAVTLPDWVDATPAVGADGTIYVGCWDGVLYAFTAGGVKKWEYSTAGYIASSPAVSGDGVIYVGSGDFNLHAVNPDGTRRWLYPTTDWVDGSPAVGVDGTIYVGAGRTFYAVTPDGLGRWQASLLGAVVGSPVVAVDGTIYVAARDKRIYSFAPNGTLLWFFETGDAIDASPVLGADGTIYVGSIDGRFYALDREGREAWRYPRAGQPAMSGIYSTAAVRADGSVVFGSTDNAVYALTSSGTLLWKTTIGDWADSSPVVGSDGTIYIGSYDKKLYALGGTSGPAKSEWPMFGRDAARASWQPLGLPPGGDGRLANTSVRSQLVPDGPPLTVGFSVAGNGERTLLVRGIGPALTQFGIVDAVAEPRLRIFPQGSSQPLVENHAWHNAPDVSKIMTLSAAVGAFPLLPTSDDTAVLREFTGGGYSAAIDSRGNKEGIVLAEIYDAGGTGARLINLSARAEVAEGEGVLTAGFVISDGNRILLIRGVGPTLAQFGVGNALIDSRLQVFAGGSELAAENDNWAAAPNATAAAAAMQAVGAFPLDPSSRDAALLVQVGPGAYTVQLSGIGGARGTALIEVYELP